ncbi:MAG: acetyl-CoA carboxylase carboxyl transferase beta subunit [Candidatus Latescibacterota bacterium]|jgi:acetyl-CoA carboxylase carboxyl transferase beta subunit
MNWFEKMKSGLTTRIKREIPQGIWVKCKKCGHSNYEMALERNHWICPECSHHYPISHQQYVDLLVDTDTFVETNVNLAPVDPLRFRGYKDKIKEGRRKSGARESVHTGTGRIGGHPVALCVMDQRFVMGTLGAATGEKIARLIDRAIAERRTLVIICQSGGARMQESAFSLMQMARVSAKLHQLSNAGLLYIPILTDPTYGGVTASFAMLGDLILAEPGARIGFAGQTVIKQFLGAGAELPEGFQVAETVLEHGFIDRIIRRDQLAAELASLIALLAPTESETRLSTHR